MDKPHKRLKAWQLAMDIAVEVYKLTDNIPAEEKYGLVSQIRRSAVSIASNIAEGAARNSKKVFLQFLYIARGSISELDTQLELTKKLQYLDESLWDQIDEKIVTADKVLAGLIRSQKKDSIK